ncbi:MAG: hypothetical protein QW434_00505 [Pyrobaculum sp.]
MRTLAILPIALMIVAVVYIAIVMTVASPYSSTNSNRDTIRITLTPTGGASQHFLNGFNFYFRVYVDGEWCDLWSEDVAFVDNGTHITLMLKNGKAQCRTGSYRGQEEGGWIRFEVYNITRRGTVRGVEPFYVPLGGNAVVVYRDYELPGLTIQNKTALFVIVEDGLMKYNAVMVEREASVSREVAMRMLNETARLEPWLHSQGIILAPYKWRYENGKLFIEPGVELRFSKPVVKRSLTRGNTTYYFYFDGYVMLVAAMDIYKSAIYTPECGGYKLRHLAMSHESLSYLPYPLPEIFKIHPASTGRGEITIILE